MTTIFIDCSREMPSSAARDREAGDAESIGRARKTAPGRPSFRPRTFTPQDGTGAMSQMSV
jgi:hypothetical protein